MKTIAQQLNVKEFPFEIKDKNGNVIYRENFNGTWSRWEYIPNSLGEETYSEDSNGFWYKRKFDSNGEEIYYENSYGESYGYIEDNRPKGCEGKVVEIDGKKYKLVSE
jgi:hypothetical protein